MVRLGSLGLAAALLACSPAAGPAPGGAAPVEPPSPAPDIDVAPPPREDGRLPGGVQPVRQRVELTLDPRQPTFLGKATLDLEIAAPSRAIVLHGRKLTVRTASLDVGGRRLWAKTRARAAAGTRGDPEELVVAFDEVAPAGRAVLEIEYEAPFSDGLDGIYSVTEAGERYAFTQFEPNDARKAFPCFDEPSAKIPFEIVITVPEGHVAVSNMPLVRRREAPTSGLHTFEFAPSPPMPSYLVALAAGPLDVREGAAASVPIRLVSVRGKAHLGTLALEAAREQLGLLESYFGRPYPYPKLDLVAVPNFAAGAMENAGLVTFREELVLLDTERASVTARRGLAGVMAHELAHMWFGDLVTMQWWDDLWLNEGFATWMGTKIVDQWRPALGAGLGAVARKAMVMSADSLDSARRVRQPVASTSAALEAFDGITYVKGHAVLAMVETWVGEEPFRDGVRKYVDANAWKNARAGDLFRELSAASGKDVAGVLDGFLDQTGVPLVEASVVCSPKPAALLRQKEYRLLPRDGTRPDKRWRFPVCVKFGDGKRVDVRCAELSAEEARVELPWCPKWLHPNVGEAGYYRHRQDDPAFDALVGAMKHLSDAERVGLGANAWALVASGDSGADTYLDLQPALTKLAHRVLWEQSLDALATVRRDLVPDAGSAAFAGWVRGLVGPAARAHGWKASLKDDDDRRLARASLVTALGALGQDPVTLAEARKHAEAWLADPASVEGELAAIAVPLAARSGDAVMVDRLVARLAGAASPEARVVALTGLSSLTDPALIRRALGLTLDGTIKVQDLRYVFSPYFARPETKDLVYEWVTANFDALAKRVPQFVLGRFVWAAASRCDDAQVEAARSFFAERVAQIEGAERQLAQAVEAGRRCAAMARVQRPKVEAWLERAGRVPKKGRVP